MYKVRSRWHVTAFIILTWGVYCVVTLLTPQDTSVNKYNISPVTINFLIISVSLPYLICWLYAASAWLHLQDFTRKQPVGIERQGFAKITYGLLVLLASLIVPTIIRTFYIYFTHNPNGAGWNIFSNYMGIAFPLVSFWLMFLGSSQIAQHIQPKITLLSRAITALFPVAIFSVFYLFMIFTNPIRQTSPDPAIPATYFLSDGMIILTIIVPVITTWLLGLLLVLNLEHYSHFSRTINRSALVSFYNGIIVIVAISILGQVLASLGANRFANLSLGVLLVAVYALLGLITLGFGLIAHGAKKLEPQNQKAEPR